MRPILSVSAYLCVLYALGFINCRFRLTLRLAWATTPACKKALCPLGCLPDDIDSQYETTCDLRRGGPGALRNFLIGARLYLRAAEKDSVYPSLELFSYVMEKVRKDYVDGQKLSYRELVYGALKGMIGTLDPHSEFMDPEKYRELQSDTQGAFGGLGIIVSVKDNFLTVVVPMTDTPASRAGILSGDRIVKIDGRSTDKMAQDEAVKSLRGEPGTDVRLTILRPSSNQFKDYKLTRGVINVDMVTDLNGQKEFPLDENKIGYVRLIQFGEKTSEELEIALQRLKKQGMQGLVLDLRWNPGGLLEQAVDVCEKFLPKGQLVVTTEGRNPAQDSRPRSLGDDEVRWCADRCAGEPGQCQRLRNRRRLPPGPEAGRHSGRKNLWQGLGPEHHPAPGRLGDTPDHRQVLHPKPQSHS